MKFIISSLIVVLLYANYAYSANYDFATCVFGQDFGYFPKKSNVNGTIKIFKSESSDIQFYFGLDEDNLMDGTYGVQVLEYGLHTAFPPNLGNVFNPENLKTGACPTEGASPRVGDLGNIEIKDGQVVTPLVTYTKPTISNDPNSIIGRSIAIFSSNYDCSGTNFDFDKSTLLTYCTVGIGNLTFVGDSFNVAVDPKKDKNTARSYSDLGNVKALVEVYNTLVVPEEIEGKVFFKNLNDTFVEINAEIKGLSYQAHGFHIHMFGERSDLSGYAIGDHWFEGNQTHALPENKTRHFGDMGNFCAFNYDMSSGYYHYVTDYFKVADLLGRGMAVHNNTDDGVNVGGARVAQGVIALIDPASGEAVQLPNENWKYDVICPNGAYQGDQQKGSSYGSYSYSNEPSSASIVSSSLLVIFSIIFAIVLF